MTAVPQPPAAKLLDQLDALRAAATPGTWAVWWGNRLANGVDTSPSGGVSVDCYIGATADEDDRADYDNEPNPGSPTADAALIVAAVNNAPRLVAALRGVLALADEADAKVRRVIPGGAADSLIASGTHHIQVRDLRTTVAAALTDGTPR